MQLLSKDSNIVQNIFILYDVTGFTQMWHSIPVASKCKSGIRFLLPPSVNFVHLNSKP